MSISISTCRFTKIYFVLNKQSSTIGRIRCIFSGKYKMYDNKIQIRSNGIGLRYLKYKKNGTSQIHEDTQYNSIGNDLLLSYYYSIYFLLLYLLS